MFLGSAVMPLIDSIDGLLDWFLCCVSQEIVVMMLLQQSILPNGRDGKGDVEISAISVAPAGVFTDGVKYMELCRNV